MRPIPKIEDLDLIILSLVNAPTLNESENAMLGLAKKAEALEEWAKEAEAKIEELKNLNLQVKIEELKNLNHQAKIEDLEAKIEELERERKLLRHFFTWDIEELKKMKEEGIKFTDSTHEFKLTDTLDIALVRKTNPTR